LNHSIYRFDDTAILVIQMGFLLFLLLLRPELSQIYGT